MKIDKMLKELIIPSNIVFNTVVNLVVKLGIENGIKFNKLDINVNNTSTINYNYLLQKDVPDNVLMR